MVGIGSQDSFGEAQDFLGDFDFEAVTMLWEETGNLWRLNRVATNSAMQLYSYDLTQQSGLFFFNDDGRRVVLDAVGQSPWSPPPTNS